MLLRQTTFLAKLLNSRKVKETFALVYYPSLSWEYSLSGRELKSKGESAENMPQNHCAYHMCAIYYTLAHTLLQSKQGLKSWQQFGQSMSQLLACMHGVSCIMHRYVCRRTRTEYCQHHHPILNHRTDGPLLLLLLQAKMGRKKKKRKRRDRPS
jgi:hypothetical protein